MPSHILTPTAGRLLIAAVAFVTDVRHQSGDGPAAALADFGER